MTITRRWKPGASGGLDRHPDLVWLSPDRRVFGFGVGLRFDPGIGPERYLRARSTVADWWQDQVPRGDGPGPYAFASFTFDIEAWGSVVEVPAVTVIEEDDRTWTLTVDGASLPDLGTLASPPTDRPRFAGSSLPDHLWLEAVVSALRSIESGSAEKVVLARDHALWSKQPFDPRSVLDRLRLRFPDCFTFLVAGLVGASPELLVRRRDLEVTSRVLAGSAPRGDNTDEDDLLGRELLTSAKNLHEHALATASVGRVLAGLCQHLEQPPLPELLRLANVQHLATPFRGTLAEPCHIVDLVGALHPTAAVGGTPTDVALIMIRRLEGMNRGRYAGPVGYFDPHGDGEFAIALRCAELSGARARLFAGAGIVSGSVPEEELEETRLKLRAMLSALQ